MEILVGSTGFVGSNILKNREFDAVFNSKNIKESYGLNPDLLIYSGVKAEKYMANLNPQADFSHIEDSIENIKKINPKKIILISTIDIYDDQDSKDEDYVSDINNLNSYGKNRLYLENWVKNNISEHLIIRLPALFGINLKKNFIYDLIHPVPSKLSVAKYEDLAVKDSIIKDIYSKLDENFYIFDNKNKIEEKEIIKRLTSINFLAKNFTDSQGEFQFYNLSNLNNDINLLIRSNIKICNLVTEPISANEIYSFIYNDVFTNHLTQYPPKYNLKTKHYAIFNGINGYLKSKNIVLNEIKHFILNQNL